MKKLVLLIMTLLVAFSAFGQMTTLWEKSAATSSMPGWFDTGHLTRGFAYGQVGGEDRLVVVSRNGGNMLYVLDAANGDSLSALNPYGISGGTYNISDAAISVDGDIYVCNLALSVYGNSLKVYRWETLDDTANIVIDYAVTNGRLGDKMSVYGSKADNSLTLLFADANNPQIIRFTTTDNGATFAADTIVVEDNGGSASAAVTDGGALYHNSSGAYLKRYQGGASTVISGGVLGTGTNATEFIFTDSDNNEYVAVYQYGSTNENARIVKVPDGDLAKASTYKLTNNLGSNSNGNGAGDVAVKDNGDGTYTVFVLACNNGLGAYKFEFPVPAVDPVNMASNWEVWGDTYSFFLSGGDAARGMGYNPVTKNIYIASRAGGAYVHVLDDTTGAALDTLDMTGVTGGFYGISLMKADAADDGKIYACNLASGGDFKVYQWADEASAPTVAVQLAVTSRFGDVLEVTGSGLDTKIYASARGGTEIKVFGTTDGTNFAEVQSIPITAGAADGGISVVDETMLWVNAAWKDMTLIDTAGNALADMPFAESYYGSVLYMEAANGAKLLATNTNHSAGNRRKVEVYNITDPTTPELWASGEMGNIEEGNGNVAGNLKYDLNPDGTITLYQMATNNAIASWTLEIPEVFDIMDIADVKVDLNSDYVPDLMDSTVTIRGTVVSPTYVGGSSSYYVQDATGGVNIFKYGTDLSLSKGDVVQVTGVVDHYNGLTEVAFAAAEDVTVLSTGATVEPTVVTLADLGEAIEGDYVKVEGVELVDPSSWPADGSSASLDVTDGTTTVTFRIDSDTDLDGQTAPPWKFDLVGVASQFDSSSPYDGGYQILGTFYDDLTIYSPVLTELDENFEEWTELSSEWEFTNISLISDEYALEGTGKYLGLTTMNTPGMVKTPYIEDPKQLRYYLAEYSGGSDVWDMTVLLVDESDVVVDTLEEWGAPGDFNWHLSVVDIDMTGVYAVKFVGDPVTSGSFYLDHISVMAPPADVSVEPATIDFGIVDINTVGVSTAAVKNIAVAGAADLVIDSLVLNNDDFTAMIDTNLIAAGDSANITLTYTPTDETADYAILSVYTSAGMEMVGLEGNGKIVWPLRWREMASADWMGVSANAPRTMAYSGRTNYLYFVAHPNGYGDYIKVFDAEDGTFVQDMNMLTPLPSAGYIKINAVAATDDGQVFTCNLSSGSTFNLFRNAGYGADMHLAYSGSGIPIRIGDALAASGKGTDTKVYVSGTSAPYIYVFNTEDGMNYSLADSVAITAGAASRGIAPVQHGEYFFINGTGSAPMYIKADGTVLYTFDTGVVPSGTAINYFEVETESAVRRFVGITNGWSSGTKVVELLGTPGDDLCTTVDVINAPTDPYNTNPNGNATGMAVYSPHDNSLIELITNNGVSAYSFDMIEDGAIAPAADSVFADIDEDFESWTELSPYWTFENIRLANDAYALEGTGKYLGLVTTDTVGMIMTPWVQDPKTLNFYLAEHTGSDDWDLDVLLINEFYEVVDTLLELEAPGDFDWHQHFADINLTGVYAVKFVAEETTSGSFYIDHVTIGDPVGIADAVPGEFQLHQNYPNPFNPTTTIRFDMPEDARVHLAIFDITGRKVKTLINANVSAGYNQVVWDGTDHNGNPVSTGMYIYKLQAGDMIDVKKMTFLK